MALVRTGIYQAGGAALLAAGFGLVLLALNPPPKTAAKPASCGCNGSASQAKVYG